MDEDKIEFTIVGIISDAEFQKCKSIVQALESNHVNIQSVIQPLVEADYQELLHNLTFLGTAAAQHNTSPLVYYNGKHYIGGTQDLEEFVSQKYCYKDDQTMEHYGQVADRAFQKYRMESGHTFCFMDIRVGTEHSGKILFELFNDVCPKTCENFRQLACGAEVEGNKLTYENNVFHRVVPGAWIQAGDISSHSAGDGGHSIYGKFFPDESFAIAHDRAGILSMANTNEPHSNASQFFITLAPLNWLNKKKVAFGRVISGMDVVHQLAKVPTVCERPTSICEITACGELK